MPFDPLRGGKLLASVGRLLLKAAELGEGQDLDDAMDQIEAGLAGAEAYIEKKIEQKKKKGAR